MANFIDIFGEDFSSVLASLDELPPEVETMLLGVMDKMVYDVRTFSNSLEKSVFTMSQAGISENVIKETLTNDMGTGGSIFGKLRNDTKASIVDGINQSAKLGQYQNYDLDKGEFVWVSVGGHRICMDCDGRAGQKMTFAEWEGEGLPGSGWSVCRGFCYCVLDPTGKMSKKVDAPVKEPGPKVGSDKIGWKKVFNSGNIPANKAFQNAFNNANEKFKKLLTKIPQIKHISDGKGGSFFNSVENKYINKWIKNQSDSSYLYRHGTINMESLSGVGIDSTIRHEFGHFIHHNLHYIGNRGGYELHNIIKDHYRKSKLHGNPKEFVEDFLNGWGRGRLNAMLSNYPDLNRNQFVNSLTDFLEFDDAFVAVNKRLGNPTRSKAAKALFKEKSFSFKELDLLVRYGTHDKIPDWIKSHRNIKNYKIAQNDPLVKSLIADKGDEALEFLADLYGAITKEKIGYGHGKSYYSDISWQFHETFANLTTFYTHKNPIYWEYIVKEMPELAKYYENLIDKVNSGKLP